MLAALSPAAASFILAAAMTACDDVVIDTLFPSRPIAAAVARAFATFFARGLCPLSVISTASIDGLRGGSGLLDEVGSGDASSMSSSKMGSGRGEDV